MNQTVNTVALGLAYLALLSGIPCHASDSEPDQNAWTQFGPARDWKIEHTVATESKLIQCWKRDVGEGQSQIVGRGDRIIVASGSDEKMADGSRKLITSFSAHSLAGGDQLWKFEVESRMLDDQETFGGNRPRPQATPLLVGNNLIGLSFSGEVFCLNTKNGSKRWSMDLVKRFGAQAVQFGFSASPAAAPGATEEFVILASGDSGGLCKLRADDGSLVWKAPVASFSYATPVFASLSGTDQWIVVSREHVLGLDHASGKELWRHKLAEAGLTNVPCPLVVDENHILISGQGVGGTRGMEIRRDAGQWVVKETWFNRRLQFFYTNWTMLNTTVAMGCTLQYLTAFDVRTGEQLGRWRGYSDSNVMQFRDELLVLGGKGKAHRMRLNKIDSELTVEHSYEVASGRCWVAPSQIGERWFVRCGSQLQCLAFRPPLDEHEIEASEISNQIARGEELHLALIRTGLAADPVEQILEAFDKQGQEAALRLYAELRKANKLTDTNYVALAEAAYQINQKGLAAQIMQHAQADLPDSKAIQRKMAERSGKR